MKTNYRVVRTIIRHHGVKGQRWGVKRPDGPDGTVTGIAGKGTPTKGPNKSASKSSSKKSSSKQTSSPTTVPTTKSLGAAQAYYEELLESEDDVKKEIEYLRSIGSHEMAAKLEAEYKANLAKAKAALNPSEEKDEKKKEEEKEEEEDEEKEEKEDEKKGSGKGGGAAKKKEDEKKKEEEKKGGAGKAGAAPKEDAAKKKAEAKKEAEKKKKEAEKKKLTSMLESNKKMAEGFKAELENSRSEFSRLTSDQNTLKAAVAKWRGDLAKARESKNSARAKQIEAKLAELETKQAQVQAQLNVHNAAMTRISKNYEEWNAKVKETQALIDALEPEKKEKDTVKHEHLESFLSEFGHYGRKGMKWGIRRTPEELGHTPAKPAKESAKDLSNKDLQARITRMDLEKKYTQLTNERAEADKTILQRGKDKTVKMVGDQAWNVAGSLTNTALKVLMKKALRSAGVAVETNNPLLGGLLQEMGK